MSLPEITPLQFALLSLLFSGEKTAPQLRRDLQQFTGPRSDAAFSQLMTRLRQAAYVDALRATRTTHGRTVPECRYRLTDLGLIVWQATRTFYNAFQPPPPDLQLVPTPEAEFADRQPRVRRDLVKKKVATALQKAFRHMQKASQR